MKGATKMQSQDDLDKHHPLLVNLSILGVLVAAFVAASLVWALIAL